MTRRHEAASVSHSDRSGDDDADRDESSDQRRDRELIELLNELRVTLPGVQVLLAFMLTIPFSQRFGDLDSLQKDTFVVAFLTVTCSTILLMTPTAYHRILWRRREKEQLLVTSNRLAIVGIALLGLGIGEVVFLVMELLVDTPTALVLAICTTLLWIGLWFALPLSRSRHDRRRG
jgi:Family of unknown function (DUF6328)